MSPRTATTRRAGPAAPADTDTSAVGPHAAAGSPFPGASPEARRLAAAILEVLAGSQLPSEAARSLGLSVARYYQLEVRAVAGLLAACERRPGGRGRGPREGVAALQQECDRLRRECARQQALVRAARRTVGLATPAPTPPATSGRKRGRRPTARALKMAALLQAPDQPPTAAAGATPTPPVPLPQTTADTTPVDAPRMPAD
jgi:hypothetical protein